MNTHRYRSTLARSLLLAGICVVCSIAVLIAYWSQSSESSETLLALARSALLKQEFSAAEDHALKIPREDPLWKESRLVAGEAATRAERYEAAIEYYLEIPRDGSEPGVLAVFFLAELYRHVGNLSQAEECYRHVLTHQPGHSTARSRVAFLLGATGQRWEARPHYMTLVRQNAWTLEELVLLADLERPHEQGEYLERSATSTPDDILVQFGLATHVAVVDGHAAEGRRRLQDVVTEQPELLAAQALLGELLVTGDASAFSSWHAALPPDADQHPDIWFVRGLWFRRQDQLEVAARSFWEAVQRAPCHRRATYQLGQILKSLGKDSGREFLNRAAQFSELTRVLDTVLKSRGRDEQSLQQATILFQNTGRMWEAWAWATTAAGRFPEAAWPAKVLAQVTPVLNESTPRTIDSANLAVRHDLSHFPRPPKGRLDGGKPATSQPSTADETTVLRFDDQAQKLGIDFVYNNGDLDVSKPGARMFEQTGGGVAVLDYDGDCWPDLFFPQGSRWPAGSSEPVLDGTLTDRLFRNENGQGFVDITELAGLVDRGFGQGMAVGDFDSDGFPDLYVANIGRNQLFQNNGDGTFSDVTESSSLKLTDWTTSCLLVDLNADGHPDLFDVNYLDGPDVFELLCDGFGCSPKNFDGISDRLLISSGDGTFEHIAAATPAGKDSKGMGILAIDLTDRGRPSLFISNDQVPNFLLRNSRTESDPGVRFENEAFFNGLAYNEDGLAMACMGIASGDADGNGYPDFFVTNFRNESNSLYLQDSAGLFVDATKIAGLTGPGLPYVGWGTQFLDANLDGYEDLVVVNGHIDDYRARGEGYHMPAQLFRNAGSGRFVECDARTAGSFFQKQYLGRGLARLDWNRDGRMDFAVSNMNSPASLATNRSENGGHFLNIRVLATRSARDAIGTVARVTTSLGDYRKLLVAGDGYMASNERMLQFGLGDAKGVRELTVQWPSGHTITLSDLPVNVTVDLVEGSREATLWRGSQVEAVEIPE